jgi:hypothetical protein
LVRCPVKDFDNTEHSTDAAKAAKAAFGEVLRIDSTSPSCDFNASIGSVREQQL